MAGGIFISGYSGVVAEVDSARNLRVRLPDATVPALVGAICIFSENDAGSVTGTPYIASPETTDDYKFRMTAERHLDSEFFNYAAQNTGKHKYQTSTMTIAWSTAGLTTNGSGITTTGTGCAFNTYAEFPVNGSATTYFEIEGSLSANPPSGLVLDVGPGRLGASTAYAPTDGAYFRLNSGGLFGVANFNGVETVVGPFAWTPTPARKYKGIIAASLREVEFWMDDILLGAIETPSGQGQPFLSATLPFMIRQAHTSTASGVMQFNLTGYTVTQDAPGPMERGAELGNLLYGSYQGLSGGTMGSLANYGNSANPAAAVPTNTTAALGAGLGGQFWETATLAVTPVDGIISSYQNPAGTVSVQGRRLLIYGVTIDSYVQTVLAGGPLVAQWSLAFGHTAVALNTAEAAATKAPRRIALGSQAIAANQAVGTALSRVTQTFKCPIVVNPGEFVATVKKHVGTVMTSGVIAHTVTFDYGWE